jgi:hypothetical protein
MRAREDVVGGAVFFGHGGDLAGEAVTERVHAGALEATLSFCPGGLLSVAAIRGDLFFSCHMCVSLSD